MGAQSNQASGHKHDKNADRHCLHKQVNSSGWATVSSLSVFSLRGNLGSAVWATPTRADSGHEEYYLKAWERHKGSVSKEHQCLEVLRVRTLAWAPVSSYTPFEEPKEHLRPGQFHTTH